MKHLWLSLLIAALMVAGASWAQQGVPPGAYSPSGTGPGTINGNLLVQDKNTNPCPLKVDSALVACGNNATLGIGPLGVVQTSTTPPNGCGIWIANSNSAGNTGTAPAIYACIDQTTNGGFAIGQVFPSGADGSFNFTGNTGGAQGNTEFGTVLANGNDFAEFFTVNDGSGGFQSTVGKAQSYLGPFNSGISHGPTACETNFGPTSVNTGGVTTTTGLSCVPAGAVIDAVEYIITTAITTAANFTVGIGGSTSKFCAAQSTLTLGATGSCVAQINAGASLNASSVPVVVTFNVNPGAGALRLIVYSHIVSPPTS